MKKKEDDSKFRIVRKGYERRDVDAYIAKTERDAAAAVENQKKVIDDLKKTVDEQQAKIKEYEQKSRRISDAIMSALAKADEIEKLSAYKYAQEMEQLKTFHARWLTYYAKLIKKYPLTDDLEAISNFNDKVNSILGKTALDNPDEDDIPSFAPATFMTLSEEEKSSYKSQRVSAPVPKGESESGFSFEEALNPKESLEEIMADLGLLMDDNPVNDKK